MIEKQDGEDAYTLADLSDGAVVDHVWEIQLISRLSEYGSTLYLPAFFKLCRKVNSDANLACTSMEINLAKRDVIRMAISVWSNSTSLGDVSSIGKKFGTIRTAKVVMGRILNQMQISLDAVNLAFDFSVFLFGSSVRYLNWRD